MNIDIVEKYGPKEPLMQQAWVDCLRWAIGQDDILDQFIKDTGGRYRAPRNAIEAMIDDATGIKEVHMIKFVEWFNVNVWGDETDEEEGQG